MININPVTVLIHLGFFLMMLYVLNQLLFKPMFKMFDERESRVEGNQEAASHAGSKAQELASAFKSKMDEARKDAAKIKEEIKKSAAAEEDRIIKDARAKAGNTVADIQEKIAVEYKEASARLEADTKAMGREIAGRILGRSV